MKSSSEQSPDLIFFKKKCFTIILRNIIPQAGTTTSRNENLKRGQWKEREERKKTECGTSDTVYAPK